MGSYNPPTLTPQVKASPSHRGSLKAYTLFSCYSGCSGAAVVECFQLSCAQALQSNSCGTAARLSYMASGCGVSGRHARGAPKPNLGVSWRCFALLKCTTPPVAIRIATIATHAASKSHMWASNPNYPHPELGTHNRVRFPSPKSVPLFHGQVLIFCA